MLQAHNPGEALLIGEKHPGQIDLLPTDIVMPHLSGPELAQRLSVLRPGVKVLYMSGYTDDLVVPRDLFDSGLAFPQKPITPRASGAEAARGPAGRDAPVTNPAIAAAIRWRECMPELAGESRLEASRQLSRSRAALRRLVAGAPELSRLGVRSADRGPQCQPERPVRGNAQVAGPGDARGAGAGSPEWQGAEPARNGVPGITPEQALNRGESPGAGIQIDPEYEADMREVNALAAAASSAGSVRRPLSALDLFSPDGEGELGRRASAQEHLAPLDSSWRGSRACRRARWAPIIGVDFGTSYTWAAVAIGDRVVTDRRRAGRLRPSPRWCSIRGFPHRWWVPKRAP